MKRRASTMRAPAGLDPGVAERQPIASVQYQNWSPRKGRRLKQRRCLRSSRRVIAALIALVGFCHPAHGLTRKTDISLTITVLVYNNARASAATLAGAEREAGRILGQAGLRAVWLDCLVNELDDRKEFCRKSPEPIDMVLSVLPGHIQASFQDSLFGFAFPPALASVFYEYAGRIASSDTEIPIMLGCAIAHEIGHLLLGPSSHSAAGIMCAEWGLEQFQLALMGRLLFTSQQAKLIRADARRRMNLQTGTPKEQRLATVDPWAKPGIIPQAE